jgi:hypothetical protein
MIQTAALQTVLKLSGYRSGPIDDKWTVELTAAPSTTLPRGTSTTAATTSTT